MMIRMFRILIIVNLICISIACNAGVLFDEDFEDTVRLDQAGEYSKQLDESVSHSGKYSIRLDKDSSYSAKAVMFDTISYSKRRIAVSAWIKGENIIPGNQGWKSGRLMIWVKDKEGNGIKVDNSSNIGLIGDFGEGFAGTFDWRKFQGNFILPPGTASIIIQGALSFASGKAWIDDIHIDEIPLAWNPKEDINATINIDINRKSRLPIIGIGWNWEFVWGPPYEMDMPDDILNQFFKFAEWDEQSFIRFGYVSQYCMKNDLRTHTPEIDTGSKYSVFYKKVLSGLKKLDITLLACNWFYGNMSGGYTNPPFPLDKFVGSAADVITNWIKNEDFTNIKYVSLWNEPCWSYKGEYPDDFYTYTKEFDQRLRESGVRSSVGIMGADSTESGAAAEFRFPRYNRIMGDTVDAFAFHDYGSNIESPDNSSNSGTLYPYLRSYKNLSGLLNDKHLFMSEFGTGTSGDEANYRGTLANIELVIGGLNSGVTAFARWAYNCLWDTSIGYSPFLVKDSKLMPHKPVYYPYSLLTKTINPGDFAVQCDVKNGIDSEGYKRIHAAALIGKNRSFALIIVNDGYKQKRISLKGLPNNKKLYRYTYGSDLPDGLVSGKPIDSGKSVITIPPMSVNALISWKIDSLKPDY